MKESTIKKAAAELGRRGGVKTSERKAREARINGRKGGRPRKHGDTKNKRTKN